MTDDLSNMKYRLVTRSDFDGLVCALLLKELNLVEDILFVHPKDMQDGKININNRDITTNLPYVSGCYLAFDHHSSEILRIEAGKSNHVIDPNAMSASRVVYNYYGGKARFPKISEEMMVAVDKCDAAQFSFGEILEPKDWILLNFIMDSRTGLGRFRTFQVSNYQLMMDLIDYCRDHSIQEILSLPDVKERVDLYLEHQSLHKDQIRRCTTVYNNLAVLDLRSETTIYAGNRFTIYALYPECDISIHALWRNSEDKVSIFAVGKSIIDRGNTTDIGAMMLRYGGGGHRNAGTCQIEQSQADQVLKELIFSLVRNVPPHDTIGKVLHHDFVKFWPVVLGLGILFLAIVVWVFN